MAGVGSRISDYTHQNEPELSSGRTSVQYCSKVLSRRSVISKQNNLFSSEPSCWNVNPSLILYFFGKAASAKLNQHTKGQLISKCLFAIFNSPKNEQKIANFANYWPPTYLCLHWLTFGLPPTNLSCDRFSPHFVTFGSRE